jgi:hypothetical protein
LALCEKRPFDPTRLFALNRTLADGFDLLARQVDEPVKERGNEIGAEHLRAFEGMIRNIATVPAGAGQA